MRAYCVLLLLCTSAAAADLPQDLRTAFPTTATNAFAPAVGRDLTTDFVVTPKISAAVQAQLDAKQRAYTAAELNLRTLEARIEDERARVEYASAEVERQRLQAKRATAKVVTATRMGFPTDDLIAEAERTATAVLTAEKNRDAAVRELDATREALPSQKAAVDTLAKELEGLRQQYKPRGMPLHKTDVIVQFLPTTSITAIKEFIERYHLSVTDVIPEFYTIVVKQQGDAPTVASEPLSIRVLLERLRSNPIVHTAAPDLLVGPQLLPRSVATTGTHEANNARRYDWTWSGAPAGVIDGTIAFRIAHFPQAWNFNAAIDRQPRVRVAVVDDGFAPHDDLTTTVLPSTKNLVAWHGTHVAGIINATFDNQKGIDGCAPYAELITVAIPRVDAALDPDQVGMALVRNMMHAVADVFHYNNTVASNQRVRIINVSYGYNWNTWGIDPTYPVYANEIQSVANFFYLPLEDHPDVIIVSAAGNSSVPGNALHAQWGSPLNWIAYHPDPLTPNTPVPNVIVVGSVNSKLQRSSFSNSNSFIAAVGEGILSLGDHGGYVAADGTSQAAPQVAGTLAALWAYNPALTVSELLAALGIDRTGIHPPVLDAFRSLRHARPDWATTLADINNDGHLDAADVIAFHDALQRAKADPATAVFSRADLNGSGMLADANDATDIDGAMMTDTDVFVAAWVANGGSPAIRQQLQ